jgi:hypothetical protein
MENIKKYIKLYEEIAEESFKKWGYYYPPKTWEEFHARNNKTFEKHLANKEEGVNKTKSYVSLLKATDDFGFYIALQQADYKLLNNVIYQTSRQKLLNRGMLSSDSDHCNVLLNVLNAFACNDFEVIESFFPQQLAHSKGKYYTEVAVNLLRVLHYNEKDLKDEALKKADKFLTKKITSWEKYVILYFKALIDKDVTMLEDCLQELCIAYQKTEHSVSSLHNKLDKCFAFEIHGLYRFVRIIDNELFQNISSPNHHCFSEEFEEWQKENNYPKGTIFYEYPQRMNYMNKILQAQLPIVALYQPNLNKKQFLTDVEKFAQNLTKNTKKIL